MVKVLVDAGVSYANAARATTVLRNGGTVQQALDALNLTALRPDPIVATFTADLLLAEARRAGERVEAERP